MAGVSHRRESLDNLVAGPFVSGTVPSVVAVWLPQSQALRCRWRDCRRAQCFGRAWASAPLGVRRPPGFSGLRYWRRLGDIVTMPANRQGRHPRENRGTVLASNHSDIKSSGLGCEASPKVDRI